MYTNTNIRTTIPDHKNPRIQHKRQKATSRHVYKPLKTRYAHTVHIVPASLNHVSWDIDPEQDFKIIDEYASTKLADLCAFLETHEEGVSSTFDYFH